MNNRSLFRLKSLSLPGLCCFIALIGWQALPVTLARAAPEDDAAKKSAVKDAQRDSTDRRTENEKSAKGESERTADRNEQERRDGKRAWIGVRLEDRDTEPAPGEKAKTDQPGVTATAVYPNGPAARAGLRPGDRIQNVNGKAVSTPREVSDAIGRVAPGTTFQIVVKRNNADQTLSVVAGDAASFHPHAAQGQGQGNFQQQSYSYGGQPGQGQQNGYNQNTGGQHEANHYEGVPEHAMMLEYQRRNAEQHQRMESQIEELLQEVRSLRKEIQQLKAK